MIVLQSLQCSVYITSEPPSAPSPVITIHHSTEASFILLFLHPAISRDLLCLIVYKTLFQFILGTLLPTEPSFWSFKHTASEIARTASCFGKRRQNSQYPRPRSYVLHCRPSYSVVLDQFTLIGFDSIKTKHHMQAHFHSTTALPTYRLIQLMISVIFIRVLRLPVLIDLWNSTLCILLWLSDLWSPDLWGHHSTWQTFFVRTLDGVRMLFLPTICLLLLCHTYSQRKSTASTLFSALLRKAVKRGNLLPSADENGTASNVGKEHKCHPVCLPPLPFSPLMETHSFAFPCTFLLLQSYTTSTCLMRATDCIVSCQASC